MQPPERPTLSVVIPVFNEEATIPELDRRLGAFLADLPEVGGSWEVVFIDDGSSDRSLEMLKEMAAREARYKIVSFARNFGHQVANRKGTIENDVMPSIAKRSILRSGYFVSPAKRAGRS